ncbi:MAG TPA: carboxyl transferase domain-containing protein, partial [Terriglobales bacterium]|nr:carboxyl transferase domain-containing protein [Terriglobales bacterium]
MKFSDLDARQRVTALVDRDSFDPAFPDSSQTRFVLGTAAVAGRPVLVAFSDGHVLGGTFGVLEAERISTLLDRAADAAAPPVVILGFDTGGVRVEEGPRALAATSAAGIALAQLSVRGVRALSLISGPRGCFGAPSVMASLPERVVMTEGSFWGLTGPKLIDSVRDSAADASMAAAAAANRLHNGDCDAVVPDSAGALRSQLEDFVAAPAVTPVEPREIIGRSAAVTAELWQRLRSSNSYASPQPRWSRRRGLLEYTLRGQWHADGPIRRAGMLQAGFGLLAGHPTLSLVLGPAAGAGDGLGIEEAALLAQLLAEVVARPGPPALILSFLFCQ